HNLTSLDIREPFRGRVLSALDANPAITGIAVVSVMPLHGMPPVVPARALDRVELERMRYRFVSPEYFGVFGIALLKGRGFTLEGARAQASVTIVSETSARHWWPDGNAVGRWLSVVPDTSVPQTARIRRHVKLLVVGVARDTAEDTDPNGPVLL